MVTCRTWAVGLSRMEPIMLHGRNASHISQPLVSPGWVMFAVLAELLAAAAAAAAAETERVTGRNRLFAAEENCPIESITRADKKWQIRVLL